MRCEEKAAGGHREPPAARLTALHREGVQGLPVKRCESLGDDCARLARVIRQQFIGDAMNEAAGYGRGLALALSEELEVDRVSPAARCG